MIGAVEISTLIIGNLKAEEYEALMGDLRIFLSGATGKFSTKDQHGPLAPYIASYPQHIRDVKKVLGWSDAIIEIANSQMIMTRGKHGHY
jgi:hypothetical protein